MTTGARAYYNEWEPYAAQWLRNLIDAGHIAPGDVDERSIEDVHPADLAGYTQCHFFAGLGGWSAALRLAGWPDERPVWTGSCPCQPFSAAGKGAGFADERHLWPAWEWLLRQCAPGRIYGEQVASGPGLAWWDLVCADLEALAYACGECDLPAASVGAPGQRQRLWWVADADQGGCAERAEAGLRLWESGDDANGRGGPRELADAERGRRGTRWAGEEGQRAPIESDRLHATSELEHPAGGGASTAQQPRQPSGVEPPGDPRRRLGHTGGEGLAFGPQSEVERRPLRIEGAALGTSNPLRGRWRDADWLWCRDGKYRPVEPGTFPLAHGVPQRVGQLRAYGNAINPEVAARFILAADAAIGGGR